MFRFFGKKKEKPAEQKTDSNANAIVKLIAKGMREKRKHITVRYPEVGAIGDLPTVEFNSHSYVPINLSQGGMLLGGLPFKDLIVKQHYDVKIVWKYGPLIFNHTAELLRIAQDRFHFRFTHVDARSFMEFSKSFGAGIKGAQTRLVTGDKVPSYLLELWKAPGGEKLLFQRTSDGEVADLYYDEYRITFRPDLGLLREEENEQKQWRLQPASQDVIDEILIFLTNIPAPTKRIQKLLEDIVQKHFVKVARISA